VINGAWYSENPPLQKPQSADSSNFVLRITKRQKVQKKLSFFNQTATNEPISTIDRASYSENLLFQSPKYRRSLQRARFICPCLFFVVSQRSRDFCMQLALDRQQFIKCSIAQTQNGFQSFPRRRPHIFNFLRADSHVCTSIDSFCRQLKTYYFKST
jgi:hypothetical protein